MDLLTWMALDARRTYVASKQAANSWFLYYGSSTKPMFGPAPWGHCVSERDKLIGFNPRLQKHFFKIK